MTKLKSAEKSLTNSPILLACEAYLQEIIGLGSFDGHSNMMFGPSLKVKQGYGGVKPQSVYVAIIAAPRLGAR